MISTGLTIVRAPFLEHNPNFLQSQLLPMLPKPPVPSTIPLLASNGSRTEARGRQRASELHICQCNVLPF